jgi:hypothetical protein
VVGHVPHQKEFADILNCRVSSLPLKYLGLPLGTSFESKVILNGVVEKMEKRLTSWKKIGAYSKRLSLDGFDGEPKLHLVNWKTICSLVPRGVLGVKNLMLFNNALVGKWLWRFTEEENSLLNR